jgi:hypothetical protein
MPMKDNKMTQVISEFFKSMVEAMGVDSWNFGLPVITRNIYDLSLHKYILTKEEAKIVYESHLAFYDLVGEESIKRYNEAVFAFHDDPLQAGFEQQKFETGAWVYVIGTPEGEYKIGWSIAPEKRIEQVTAPSHGKKELLHVIRCANAARTENILHQTFHHKRIEREWFRLTPEDVAWLKSISEWP